MKISNFRDYSKSTRCNPSLVTEYAVVDVETTRFFFFKKKETRAVTRLYKGYWRFNDTGEFTPGNLVEKLHEEYVYGV